MKSSVAVWALAITLTGVVIGATKVQASIVSPSVKEWVEEQEIILDDSVVCPVAVEYSMKFAASQDAQELHKGVWAILSRQDTDDAQKLIMVTVYHTIQEVAWRTAGVKVESREQVETFWHNVKARTEMECKYALNRIRFPDVIWNEQ